MKKEEILDGMSEIYMYNCSRCGRHALSQDEIHQIAFNEFLCIKCWYKTSPEHCKWAYRPTEKEIEEFESSTGDIGASKIIEKGENKMREFTFKKWRYKRNPWNLLRRKKKIEFVENYDKKINGGVVKMREFGWLKQLIKEMKKSLRTGLNFTPSDRDIDNLEGILKKAKSGK